MNEDQKDQFFAEMHKHVRTFPNEPDSFFLSFGFTAPQVRKLRKIERDSPNEYEYIRAVGRYMLYNCIGYNRPKEGEYFV